MKYTKGPWQWTADGQGPEDDWGIKGRGVVDPATYAPNDYAYNMELYGPNWDLMDGDRVISGGGGEYCPVHGATDEEQIGNARLIAAATEMFEFLELVARGNTGNPELERRAQALRQRITGEEEEPTP